MAAAACGNAETAGTASTNISTAQIADHELATAEPNDPAATSVGASMNSNAATRVSLGRQLVRKQLTQKIELEQATRIEQAPLSFDRKIVRNADLQLETANPDEVQHKIEAIAESTGGFVVESQQSMNTLKAANRDTIAMFIRVPAAKFVESVSDIRNAADRVISENIKGDDVTEEFIDVEARLKAQKALEQQFMEIMKRAHSVEDALSVQSQLADVRGEIEKVEGRKRFLENQSSMSTIKIRLQTTAAIAASSEGLNRRLTDSLRRGTDVAMSFILGLVTVIIAILPFTVFVGLPAFLIIRYFWRKQNRPKSVSEIANDEINIT